MTEPGPRVAIETPAWVQLAEGERIMVDGAGMIDQDSAGALLTIESEAGATVALVGDRAQRLAPNTSITVMIDPETDRESDKHQNPHHENTKSERKE